MKTLLRLLLLAACLYAPSVQAAGEETIPERDLQVLLDNAYSFLLVQQAENGAFGTVQPHLQTGFAMLAILSLRPPDDADANARIARAANYLVATSTAAGDLGDDAFRTESHAVAFTALLCAHPRLADAELRAAAAKLLARGLRTTQRMQDRSSAGPSRGGWKLEGFSGRENDRRATAWALLSYHAADLYGLEVKDESLDRGVRFLLASYKAEADREDQIGGLSVDAEGLTVASISAMGGWALARLRPDATMQATNTTWLERHPPEWSGPNWFYTNFFRVRALRFGGMAEAPYRRALRRLYLQAREHQQGDGAIAFPPGNAQNTLAMGPTFATAMTILILNLDRSHLPFDQDWRLQPLIAPAPGDKPTR